MKSKGIIEDLKFFFNYKKKNDSKNISRTFSGFVVIMWVQFIFGQFLGLTYISQDLQAPSYVVSTNYRVLKYCTCHLQGGSLCFSFFCLLVSSVSGFRPDTKGMVVDTSFFFFQAHLFSRTVGREEIEATWWRKRRVQRGREQSSQ